MIKRNILKRLENHLSLPETTVLIGPRQVGKTYLMRVLQKGLEEKGEKTVFFNLDVLEHKPFFETQTALINYIRLQVGEGKAYVFIDEIQHKENAGLFLKGLYDMQVAYKFIVSGSGSLDLKAKIKESGAGRKQLFYIGSINFEEFVNFKTNYKYEGRLQDFFELQEIQTQLLLEEYMMFGGYPRVILAETVDAKKDIIEEIYTSYIEKDITDLLKVEKSGAFTDLLRLMAAQIGNLINLAELAHTIGLNDKTIQRYLWYLQETFILKKVTPYSRSANSEIVKSPVYYFNDTGLRNYLLGLFGLPKIPSALSSHLFENVVFTLINQQISYASTHIHFWRTKDNAEVDFVVEKGLEVIPVEAKYTKMKNVEITRSYRSFLARYKPSKGYIVHLGKKSATQVDATGTEKTEIEAVPFYFLIGHEILI